MSKSHWIVIALGLVLFISLSLLPTVVVESDVVALDSSSASAIATEEVIEHAQSGLDASQKVAITVAKRAYEESDGSQKDQLLDSLVSLYISFNRYDSAASYVQNIAIKGTKNDKLLEKAANLYFEAFTFALSEKKAKQMGTAAREIYESLLEKDPSRLDLKVKIGTTHVSSGAPMVGVRMIREVLEEDPTNAFAMMQLGMLSMRSGQYDKAIGHFSRLLELKEDEEALFYLGVSHVELHHHEEAEAALKRVKAITKDPNVLQTVDKYLVELQEEHQH